MSEDYPFPSIQTPEYNRTQLPQIPKGELQGLIKFLKSVGISVDGPQELSVHVIHPTQRNIDLAKVREMIENGYDEDREFLLSRDYQVIDGHHQIYTQKIKNDLWVSCYVADADVCDIISAINLYI